MGDSDQSAGAREPSEVMVGTPKVDSIAVKWWPQRDAIELAEFKYAISLPADSDGDGAAGRDQRNSCTSVLVFEDTAHRLGTNVQTVYRWRELPVLIGITWYLNDASVQTTPPRPWLRKRRSTRAECDEAEPGRGCVETGRLPSGTVA